jgi:hypothetical protein
MLYWVTDVHVSFDIPLYKISNKKRGRKKKRKKEKKLQWRKHYTSGSTSHSDGGKENRQSPLMSETCY